MVPDHISAEQPKAGMKIIGVPLPVTETLIVLLAAIG
jgi:hypothetical protein